MADSVRKSTKNSLKCAVCASSMNRDHHLCCTKCRLDKKGSDLCVTGKSSDCILCTGVPKDTLETSRSKRAKTSKILEHHIDDSILDEETPSSTPVNQSKSVPDSTLNETLAALMAQVQSLSSKMDSFEKKSSESNTSSKSTNSSKANATTVGATYCLASTNLGQSSTHVVGATRSITPLTSTQANTVAVGATRSFASATVSRPTNTFDRIEPAESEINSEHDLVLQI